MSDLEFPSGSNCARVIGIKRDLFVEFEFIAGDPTLMVELVLPFAAFQEFYAVNDVVMLPGEEDIEGQFKKLCEQHGAKFTSWTDLGLAQD